MKPEERGLVLSLRTGEFITCGCIGKWGEKAAEIVEQIITERDYYYERMKGEESAKDLANGFWHKKQSELAKVQEEIDKLKKEAEDA